MNATNIAWTDFTWNPITGCTSASSGCKNCYAKTVHERFNDTPFSDIIFHDKRLEEPLRRKKPCKIFVGSMTDLFQSGVGYRDLEQIMQAIVDSPQHTFQILTKRAENMKKFFEWFYGKEDNKIRHFSNFDKYRSKTIPNLWIGVSAEDQKTSNERIPLLLDTPAAKRFVSIEPMIGKIDIDMLVINNEFDTIRNIVSPLMGTKTKWFGRSLENEEECNRLDWVIVGGESGAKSVTRPMEQSWVSGVYNDCVRTDIPFFFKQEGAHKFKRVNSDEKFIFEQVQDYPIS